MLQNHHDPRFLFVSLKVSIWVEDYKVLHFKAHAKSDVKVSCALGLYHGTCFPFLQYPILYHASDEEVAPQWLEIQGVTLLDACISYRIEP